MNHIQCIFYLLNKAILHGGTHVIARFENSLHIFVHIVVVQRHEERIDDDAERDEELYERVKDQQGHVLLKLEPEPAAVPDAKDVDTTEHSGQ